jgi:intein/homing endonuclease
MRVKDVVALFEGTGKEIQVLSYNGETSDYAPINKAWMTKKDAELVRVTDTETGRQLVCTPDHQIFTHNRGYVRADSLLPDDKLEIYNP